MAATIKRIAELAGVSIGTVDRVVNNRGKVSPAVESRIRKIIEEVNYTPNMMAKSLAIKRRSPKIGIIFHLKSSSFYDEVTKGIEKARKEIADFGVSLIIKPTNNFDVDDQLKNIDELIEQDVKAIAIAPINDERIAKRIDELIQSGLPVFSFVNDIETKYEHPFIGPNAFDTGKIAAGLINLISAGQKQKIAVISPPLKMLSHIQKIDGLRDTIEMRYKHIELAEICEVTNNDIQSYNAVKNYFAKHKDITILWYAISINDGGITALKELNLLNKIKIISLDVQSFIRKGLEEGYISATICQNPSMQGYLSVKTVFNTLLKGKYPVKLFEEVPCEILIRENYIKSK